jgi:hypothetical protein
MTKQCAYVFLSRSRDWECFVTTDPREAEGDDDLYLAGEVSSLKELFKLMEDNDFDAEYFYEYVDHCMSHRLFNMLNKDGAY